MEFDVLKRKIDFLKNLGNSKKVFSCNSSLRLFYVYGENRKDFLSGLLLNSLEYISLDHGQVAWLLSEKGHVISYMYIFAHENKFAIIAPEETIRKIYEELDFYSLVDDDIELKWEDKFERSFLNIRYETKKFVNCFYSNGSYGFSFNNILATLSLNSEVYEKIPQEYEELILNNNFLNFKKEQLFIPELALDEITEIMINRKCFLGKSMNTRMHSRGHINKKLKIFELDGNEFNESLFNIIRSYEIDYFSYNLYENKLIFSILVKGKSNLEKNIFMDFPMIKELFLKNYLTCNRSLKS